jgi:hypothetical protein
MGANLRALEASQLSSFPAALDYELAQRLLMFVAEI